MEPTRLRVPELRYELGQRNLDTTGSKVVLVSRLQFAIEEEHRANENSENQSIEHSTESGVNSNQIVARENLETISNNDSEQNFANEIVDFDSNRNIDSNTINSNENQEAVNNNVFAPIVIGNKVNYILMPGKRKNSELLYSIDEEQFYKKNKTLKNGNISMACHHNNCNRHVYLNKIKGECVYQVPYTAHNHSPEKKKFETLTVLNSIKAECSKPEVLSKGTSKTSVVKSIFNEKIHE